MGFCSIIIHFTHSTSTTPPFIPSSHYRFHFRFSLSISFPFAFLLTHSQTYITHTFSYKHTSILLTPPHASYPAAATYSSYPQRLCVCVCFFLYVSLNCARHHRFINLRLARSLYYIAFIHTSHNNNNKK